MKAGRKLDAQWISLVEKVMGWKECNVEYRVVLKVGTEEEGFPTQFNPFEEISDAWLVRKWLIDNIGGVEIITTCGDNELVKVWDGQNYIRTNAKTAPLAICLAALKAVGVVE